MQNIWVRSFSPLVFAIIIMIVGVSQQRMIVAMPAMVCIAPGALWWSGYAIGKAGASLRNPIQFGGADKVVMMQSNNSGLSDQERRVLEQYRNRKKANNGARARVGKDLG